MWGSILGSYNDKEVTGLTKKKTFKIINKISVIYPARNSKINASKSDTFLHINVNSKLCIDGKQHKFSNAESEQLITRSGRSYNVWDIPVLSCDICKEIILNEDSIVYIDRHITKLEIRFKNKEEILEALSKVPITVV
jgi:hypothetical protein